MIRVKNLSVLLALALSMTAITAGARAQDKDAKPAEKPAETAAAAPPKEESSVTDHIIKLGGQTIPYKATAATILLKNEKDEPTALVYYTAYTRSDAKDLSQRPIAFRLQRRAGLFLGVAAHGLIFAAPGDHVNADATPPAPYKLSENPHCLLDKTDLVFLDPVGTGFSHAVGKAQDKDFWVSIKTSNHWRNSSAPTSAATAAGILRNFSLARVTELSLGGAFELLAVP